MPKMTRICRFENRYLRCNSPAIYPQNWFSSVPTFCSPGVAFCSKTAILGPGSGSERGVIYDPYSRFWAQICGGKSKKSPMETIELWKSNGGKDQDRTGDTRIFNPLLYQLSYPATGCYLIYTSFSFFQACFTFFLERFGEDEAKKPRGA